MSHDKSNSSFKYHVTYQFNKIIININSTTFTYESNVMSDKVEYCINKMLDYYPSEIKFDKNTSEVFIELLNNRAKKIFNQ